MHPAPSIILFTTISGLGFGFLFWLGLFGWNDAGLVKSWIIALVGGGVAAGGLSFSLGHLGHPERAWMALSQWRSSWLSREGVAAVFCLMIFGLWCAARLFLGMQIPLVGLLVALGSAGTVYTTSMIYTQLKTVPRWNHFLTPVLFLATAAASGNVLYALLVNPDLVWLALVLVLVALGVQIAWRVAAGNQVMAMGGTPESATGLGNLGKVRLFEKPHSGKNYLLTEMVHQIGRKHAQRLQRLSIGLNAIGAPVALLLALVFGQAWLLALALVCLIAGTLASRWLFFAEAEHVVGLYYGKR